MFPLTPALFDPALMHVIEADATDVFVDNSTFGVSTSVPCFMRVYVLSGVTLNSATPVGLTAAITVEAQSGGFALIVNNGDLVGAGGDGGVGESVGIPVATSGGGGGGAGNVPGVGASFAGNDGTIFEFGGGAGGTGIAFDGQPANTAQTGQDGGDAIRLVAAGGLGVVNTGNVWAGGGGGGGSNHTGAQIGGDGGDMGQAGAAGSGSFPGSGGQSGFSVRFVGPILGGGIDPVISNTGSVKP